MTFAAEIAAAATATKYARQIPFYTADRLHPEIRFTRLGAVLRQLASDDPTAADGGELDPAIALARGVVENGGPHDGPMNLLPLHVLRDYMLEHPEHPLAQRFSWDQLPEKVALDRTVRQRRHPQHNWDHFIDPSRFMNGLGYNAIMHARDEHPWASVADVQQSAKRMLAQNDRMLYGGDGRGDAHADGAAQSDAPSPERYSLAVADAIEQPLRYAADPQSHAAFQAAIAKANATGDLLPRKVYADFLEENGDHFDDATLKLLRNDDPRPVYFHPSRKGKWAARTWPRLTISDIRRISREKGSHSFDADTMRFFGSRLERKVHQGNGGTYFVHSGDNFDGTARIWKVTQFDPETGHTNRYYHVSGDPTATRDPNVRYEDLIRLPADFGSREAAHAAAVHLAKHGVLPPEDVGEVEFPQQMQRRDAAPVRYGKAKRRLTVHPLLRGTRLAVALRTLTKDRDASDDVRNLAKAAMEQPYHGVPFHALADALEESQHPLADRYNWAAIPQKLQHDAETLTVLKRHVRRQAADAARYGTHYDRDGRVTIANSLLRSGHVFPAFHADAERHLRHHFPGISDKHIAQSIGRLRRRVADYYGARASRSPEFRDLHRRRVAEEAVAPLPELIAKEEALGDVYPDERWQQQEIHDHEATRYSRPRVGGLRNALRLLRSRNQRQRRGVAADVLTKLGLQPAKLRDAVTASGAPVASVLAAIYHGGDEAKSEAAAAWFGHLLQLPSVTAFHADSKGPDAVYKLTLPLDPSDAAAFLQSHGVGRVVLSPNGTATDAVVHDPGAKQRDRVAAAAAAANLGEVQETRGRSVRLGGSDASQRPTADARRSYRDVISAFEASNGSNPAE